MKDGFESLGRVRVQGFALLLATFVAGLLAGMAVERVWIARRPPDPPGAWGPMRGGMPPGFERLNLSDEQRDRIQMILRETRPLTDSVLRSSLPRLRAIRDSVHETIRAVLTPEQREQFDALEPRWGGPGGPAEWSGPGGRRGPGRPWRPGPGPEPPPPDSR